MNEKEQRYFDDLREHHIHLAESLNDPSLRGVRQVISNLYRDDAHFVYELLQNADDQGATFAKFILSENELIFIHNAPRHFTISDRHTHEKDKKAGKLGNVNSILSIASSSKEGQQEEIPIGKFGLGFKSVFLFTDIPEIYDENIRFSISDYIVPTLIENDHPLRAKDETLFRFRFKQGEEDKAYTKISDKLANLVNPMLFLNNLRKIDWETEEDTGYYRLSEIGKIGSGCKFKYETVADETVRTLELWKFEHPVEENSRLKVAVVFPIENGILTTSLHPLYCYLPTANSTKLPVLLHAPFKLTGNRESIMADEEHNKHMIALLSELLVQSLKEICEIGETEGSPLIKDNILGFLPPLETQKSEETAVKLDITPLTRRVQDSLNEFPLLWCDQLGCYLKSNDSLIAENNYLGEIYPSSLLPELYGERKGWVLPSLTSDLRKDKGFISRIGAEFITPEKILRKITTEFLGARSIDWLKEWYKSLMKVPNLWDNTDGFLRYKPFVLTSEENSFKAPYTKGEKTPNIFISSHLAGNATIEGFDIVNPELLSDNKVYSFFRQLELTKVDSFIMAKKVYLPQLLSKEIGFEERLKIFIGLIGVFENNLTSSQQREIRQDCPLPAYHNGKWDFYDKIYVKVHNEVNDFFYRGNPSTLFFESSQLPAVIDEIEKEMIEKFLSHFEITEAPTITKIKIGVNQWNVDRKPIDAKRPAWYNLEDINFEYFEETKIDGWNHFLTHSAPSDPKRASALLLGLPFDQKVTASYNSIRHNVKNPYAIEPAYMQQLRDSSWIDVASAELRRLLGLPVKELQPEEFESVRDLLADSGIASQSDVDALLRFMKDRDILKDFQLHQSIEEQKSVVSTSTKCSLRWFKEILNLRLKYVEAKEKEDIEMLISKLLSALDTISVDEDTDLRELLPDNINIIFGPPGTGKTTKITSLVSSMLKENSNQKILILTPTNAAAKVVVERLRKIEIDAYRGINPSNEELHEELENLDIPIYDATQDYLPNVLVATVHYFTQTYSSMDGCYLCEIPWDSIFIDETSMVTLDYVLFALIKGAEINSECTFYLVGDPLQLPPITNLDPFILEEAQLDEFNFYSFIGLTEFNERIKDLPPELEKKLRIHLLTSQYRSVPDLCRIMSRFAYKDKINSAFKGEPLNLPSSVSIIFRQPISFVRFGVTDSRGNDDRLTITGLDKLKGSNYNIYSALLVKECLQRFFNTLREEGYKRPLSIGIITPYTAQKKLIEKLLNAPRISSDVNINLEVNTVHQFQGDEFDIVMLVLNPPNKNMHPKDNILINKRYLINVATSRAKYSLIILYPDHSCEEKNFLHVNRGGEKNNIEQIATSVLGHRVQDLTVHALRIEEEMFGDSHALEKKCEVLIQEEINLYNSDSLAEYRFVKGDTTIDIIYSSQV